MRLISITQCQPGMKLGKNIYNEEGRVLLGSNMELTSTIIKRLHSYGIDFLYVFDSRTEDIVVPDMISDETRIRTMATIRSSFGSLMTDTHKRRSVNRFDRDLKSALDMIIEDVSNHKEG